MSEYQQNRAHQIVCANECGVERTQLSHQTQVIGGQIGRTLRAYEWHLIIYCPKRCELVMEVAINKNGIPRLV